jgi:hypothetical protein
MGLSNDIPYIKRALLADLRGCPHHQKIFILYGCLRGGLSGSFMTVLPLQTSSIVASASGLKALVALEK